MDRGVVEGAEENDETDVEENSLESVASQSQHLTEPDEPLEPLGTLEWQKFCRGRFKTLVFSIANGA